MAQQRLTGKTEDQKKKQIAQKSGADTAVGLVSLIDALIAQGVITSANVNQRPKLKKAYNRLKALT